MGLYFAKDRRHPRLDCSRARRTRPGRQCLARYRDTRRQWRVSALARRRGVRRERADGYTQRDLYAQLDAYKVYDPDKYVCTIVDTDGLRIIYTYGDQVVYANDNANPKRYADARP